MKVWVPSNPLSLNVTLLATKAYALYHHLYALEMMPGGPEIRTKLSAATKLQPEDFEYRWSTD